MLLERIGSYVTGHLQEQDRDCSLEIYFTIHNEIL